MSRIESTSPPGYCPEPSAEEIAKWNRERAEDEAREQAAVKKRADIVRPILKNWLKTEKPSDFTLGILVSILAIRFIRPEHLPELKELQIEMPSNKEKLYPINYTYTDSLDEALHRDYRKAAHSLCGKNFDSFTKKLDNILQMASDYKKAVNSLQPLAKEIDMALLANNAMDRRADLDF